MLWSGNALLSSATAVTTPQEFFLGSQYHCGGHRRRLKIVASRTAGRRSSIQISGSDTNSPVTFLWRVGSGGVSRSSTKPPSRPWRDQAGVFRYPGVTANYVLSVYEIPSAASDLRECESSNRLKRGWYSLGKRDPGRRLDLWRSGSVVRQRNLYRRQFAAAGECCYPATVGGVSYATSTDSLFDQPGTREHNGSGANPRRRGASFRGRK